MNELGANLGQKTLYGLDEWIRNIVGHVNLDIEDFNKKWKWKFEDLLLIVYWI